MIRRIAHCFLLSPASMTKTMIREHLRMGETPAQVLNYVKEYPDLLLIPKDATKEYYAVMIEFKYLKKGDENKLEEKQKEAREQIKEYSEYEEIKQIEKLNKYTVVAVVDKIYVEKIEN